MNITRITPIDWVLAIDTLSADAFYLLNILYKKNIPISDKSLMAITKLGRSTHRKYKKELLDNNYLDVRQTGRGIYEYIIGEDVSYGK